MVRLITFTDENMTISANICRQSALRNNVDSVNVYTPEVYTKSFRQKNESIVNAKRGPGYWIWKPYIILEELYNVLRDGDILIYSDAGVEIINNVYHIIDRMEQNVFLFGNMYNHHHWCKYDVTLDICKQKKLINTITNQVQASVIFMRVCSETIGMMEEWLRYCMKPGFIDDSPGEHKNHPEFREHRHDQAILTCVAYRRGIKLHWWPAIYNAGVFKYDHTGYDDRYPEIFHHHRMRNNQYFNNHGIDRVITLYMKNKGYQIC